VLRRLARAASRPSFLLRAAALPAAAALLLLSPGAAAAKTPAQIAASAVPGVVSIASTFAGGGEQQAVGTGSGFVLDRAGHVLTNEHVIENASTIHVSFADGTKVNATVVGKDPLLDLAVLKVNVRRSVLHPLVLGSAERLRLGDPLVAVGNPFGLDRSVSTGVVSGLHRQITAPNGFTLSNAVQTDTAVNHGNSGGPLLDARGRVIGVNAQIADSGVDANVGVAFAVAIDGTARRSIRTMLAGKPVRHSWLGVALDDVDAILATSGRVHATSGALITGVVPGGPAARAGIRGGSSVASIDGVGYCLGGDIVVAVGAKRVMDSAALQTAIVKLPPGAKTRLTVVRAAGMRTTLTVTLGTQPSAPPQASSGCG
jgi:S1-C subfamily serine protease